MYELASVAPFVRFKAWLIWLGLSAIFIVSALWHAPAEPSIILCPFRFLTGLPCPGCGMTRAFCAIAHGQFHQAVSFNALSPLLFLVCMIIWLYAAATILNLQSLRRLLQGLRPAAAVGKLALTLALVLVVLWWSARLNMEL